MNEGLEWLNSSPNPRAVDGFWQLNNQFTGDTYVFI